NLRRFPPYGRDRNLRRSRRRRLRSPGASAPGAAFDLRPLPNLQRLLRPSLRSGALAPDPPDLPPLLHPNAHQLLGYVPARRRHHVHEDVVALFLVLLLRIALPVAAEPDAVAQVLHVRQVLDPGAIDLFQIEVTEDPEQELRPHLLLFLFDRDESLLVEG